MDSNLEIMKILVIYSRDIGLNDSGGARTTIQLLNYLVNKGCECYTTFNVLEGGSSNIQFLGKKEISIEYLNKTIVQKGIDIFLVPEGRVYSELAFKSCVGTPCKVVSALHSKPGYERQRLGVLLRESVVYNKSLYKKIRAGICLILYPFFYYLYTGLEKYRFRKLYKYSHKIVLLAETFFEEFKNVYRISDTKKFVAIGNALSFDDFASRHEIENKKQQILVVARFDERSKRISYVLKVWKRIQLLYPKWTLELVGNGRSWDYYTKLCKKNKLERVTFHGMQPPLNYYKEASILIMTSAFEGWGMTITEAQQMGCVPIVMDTFSSLRILVDNNCNGVIVDDNLDDLTNKLENLIIDNDIRKKLAMNAVISSKRFVKEIVCEKYYQLFNELINE